MRTLSGIGCPLSGFEVFGNDWGRRSRSAVPSLIPLTPFTCPTVWAARDHPCLLPPTPPDRRRHAHCVRSPARRLLHDLRRLGRRPRARHARPRDRAPARTRGRPADDAVYAAGHLGVFRLANGTAVRVADRFQDTMGFTVTGPSTFLASGHPSPTDPDARSPHLGLIRSTDAGRTWQKVSAEGEADFHSLVQVGAATYGFDSQSGRVWASTDGGRSWDKRATQPVRDLAAHAAQPQQVWAATGQGLLRSGDGAATFEQVADTPAAIAVEQPEPGLVLALGTDGRVLAGGEGGPWSPRGSLPSRSKPTLLTAVSADHLLAADSADAVYESTDGGRTWRVLYGPSAGPVHP
ncbi:F510_1955 family glycosylhydrolase [Streptomyces goshikiensis]|uniref:F510_1955 family glycosylhydrolase n=1 Tax=Streptomyces goshikiensis TaxID=1942 RepID=UPI003691EE20